MEGIEIRARKRELQLQSISKTASAKMIIFSIQNSTTSTIKEIWMSAGWIFLKAWLLDNFPSLQLFQIYKRACEMSALELLPCHTLSKGLLGSSRFEKYFYMHGDEEFSSGTPIPVTGIQAFAIWWLFMNERSSDHYHFPFVAGHQNVSAFYSALWTFLVDCPTKLSFLPIFTTEEVRSEEWRAVLSRQRFVQHIALMGTGHDPDIWLAMTGVISLYTIHVERRTETFSTHHLQAPLIERDFLTVMCFYVFLKTHRASLRVLDWTPLFNTLHLEGAMALQHLQSISVCAEFFLEDRAFLLPTVREARIVFSRMGSKSVARIYCNIRKSLPALMYIHVINLHLNTQTDLTAFQTFIDERVVAAEVSIVLHAETIGLFDVLASSQHVKILMLIITNMLTGDMAQHKRDLHFPNLTHIYIHSPLDHLPLKPLSDVILHSPCLESFTVSALGVHVSPRAESSFKERLMAQKQTLATLKHFYFHTASAFDANQLTMVPSMSLFHHIISSAPQLTYVSISTLFYDDEEFDHLLQLLESLDMVKL